MHDVSTIFVEDLQYYEVKVIQPRNRDLFLLSSVDTHSLCDKVIRKRLWSLAGLDLTSIEDPREPRGPDDQVTSEWCYQAGTGSTPRHQSPFRP